MDMDLQHNKSQRPHSGRIQPQGLMPFLPAFTEAFRGSYDDRVASHKPMPGSRVVAKAVTANR